MSKDAVERRIFRAAVLFAMAEAQEKIANLDTDDATKWHGQLIEAFTVIEGLSRRVLNEMNAEVIRRRALKEKR